MKNYLGEFEVDDTCEYLSYTPSQWALEYIVRYGGIDGSHHKDWVMDQVVRILNGTPVLLKVARWSDGSEEVRFITGKPSKQYHQMVKDAVGDDYNWNVGVAP